MTGNQAKPLVFTILDILQLKNDDYENIYCVNSLCLLANHKNEYIEEKNGNQYLTFDSTDKNI